MLTMEPEHSTEYNNTDIALNIEGSESESKKHLAASSKREEEEQREEEPEQKETVLHQHDKHEIAEEISQEISQTTHAESVVVETHQNTPLETTSEAQLEEEKHDPAAGVEEHKSAALIKEQLRFCATVLKGLKRHPQSQPFQLPVDPVALNIPDYLDIIKSPMDLGTVSKKVEEGEYSTADSFIADVRLILQNCFTYNHPDSQVAKMGHSLEKYFNTQLGKMPTSLPVPGSVDDSRRKSEGGAMNHAPLSAQRARRESHAPARLNSSAMVGSSTPRGRARSTANPEAAFCNGVLREITKKSNQTITWPFIEPVDPVKLGIPDYFEVIKNPMDLSTVRRKLDAGQYSNAEQFEADVRLIIANCFAYNAPDSDVVGLCRSFEKLFDKKWSQKHHHQTTTTPTPSHHHQPATTAANANNNANFDDGDSDSEKILEINRQIQALQQELSILLMKRKSRPTSTSNSTPRPRKPSAPKAAPKPIVITEEEFLARPMTFEEKRQLSLEVNNLSPEKLGKVVEIIQSGMALEAKDDSDVIELDIESLNVRTLRQLQKYVMECKGITSLAQMLGEAGGSVPAKRKKPTTTASTAGGSNKKTTSTASTSTSTPATAAAAAAATVMSSDDEESSDEDLD